MRDSLSMSKLDYISLEKEIEFISNYLDLEKLRFENMFEYEIRVDPALDKEAIQVPTLLIQPLLENSVKHGFRHIEKGGRIEVEFSSIEDTHLEILIRDNGVGMDDTNRQSPESKEKESYGIEIVRQRIALIRERTVDVRTVFEFIPSDRGLSARIVILKVT
jgi:LytS/YehU family sensor histidine kinase